MPPVTAAETQATLLEAWVELPSEGQRTVLSYALFLLHQEALGRIANDEAAWERHFSQSEKMMRFAEWSRLSLVQHPPEPLDESRL